MADYGAKLTDKAIAKTEKQIRHIYKKAGEELRKKLEEFTARFEKKDAEMRAALETGEITKSAYDQWKTGQVFIGKQWRKKVDQAAEIMNKANMEAAMLVQSNRMNVFAENYNFEAYLMEQATKGVASFNLFSDEAVAKLVKEKPQILPKWKIDQKKDYKWNRQKVENTITQGIIQGKRIDEMASDLVDNLCTTNKSKMTTFARTAMTGAQNAGRQEQMEDAEEEGIEVEKEWVATLDNRTRDTHQRLDGQKVPVDKPFEIDGMEIMFPGDPACEYPEMTYNCRCTMIEVFKGIKRKSVRRAYEDELRVEVDEDGKKHTHKDSYLVENMTYTEWKKWKEGRK